MTRCRTATILVLSVLLGGCNDTNNRWHGTVEWDRAAVLAEVSEPLLTVAVSEGQSVNAGQLLLQLDPRRTDELRIGGVGHVPHPGVVPGGDGRAAVVVSDPHRGAAAGGGADHDRPGLAPSAIMMGPPIMPISPKRSAVVPPARNGAGSAPHAAVAKPSSWQSVPAASAM